MSIRVTDNGATVSLFKLLAALVAGVCLGGLIHTYPTDPGWVDEVWGSGAVVSALLVFILP